MTENEEHHESCQICNSDMNFIFELEVLCRHKVRYFHCSHCGFARTETPFWLEEAYSRAIALTDTGLVRRNLWIAKHLLVLLDDLFDGDGPFIDLAAGTGLLTRLMRDAGIDMRCNDPFCENILAAGFEGDLRPLEYTSSSAFEAIEHMPQPQDFVAQALSLTTRKTFVFSTELYKGNQPSPDWWYLATRTGQHISFFRRDTLDALADLHGLRALSYRDLHLITAQSVSERKYQRLLRSVNHGRHWWVSRRYKKRSLTQQDHEALLLGLARPDQ